MKINSYLKIAEKAKRIYKTKYLNEKVIEKIANDTEKKFVKKIYDFFINSSHPINDKMFHEFATINGIDPSSAEAIVYGLLQNFLSGGKSKGKGNFEVNQQEMELGMQEEMEHTNEPLIAHKIALDHLIEDPQYYTKLKQAGL